MRTILDALMRISALALGEKVNSLARAPDTRAVRRFCHLVRAQRLPASPLWGSHTGSLKPPSM